MGLCCENCFSSEAAIAFIRKHSDAEGECEYCGNQGSLVTEACELKELFSPLVNLYKSAEDRMHFDHQMEMEGHVYYESLAELICEDWEIFNDSIDISLLNGLLDDICHGDIDPSHRHGFVYPADHAWIRCEDCIYGIKPEDTWRWFANHLKGERRFIIHEGPDGEIVRPERWIGQVIEEFDAVRIYTTGDILFRGRKGSINSSDMRGLEPLPISEMGSPPRHLAIASRASSEGIPVLYAASHKKVAAAEAGRFPGAYVSVREINPIVDLRLADLTQVPAITDPLGIPDLAQRCKFARLLHQLNFELSKPIHPDESKIEYIPTQYLSEAIKVVGYDGFCYRSCMEPSGVNIVIFDPEKVQVTGRGEVLKINSISMDIRPTQRLN